MIGTCMRLGNPRTADNLQLSAFDLWELPGRGG